MHKDPTTPFTAWLDVLRNADPAFAEASARCPDSRWEWQAPAYLLSGETALWRRFGPMTIADGHFGLVTGEALALYGFNADGEIDTAAPTLADRAGYTGSDAELLSWVQYLWTDQWIEGTRALPHGLDQPRWERWHTAVRIRRGQAPA